MRTIDPALMLAVIANEDAAHTSRQPRITRPMPLPAVQPEPDSWEDEVTQELPRLPT